MNISNLIVEDIYSYIVKKDQANHDTSLYQDITTKNSGAHSKSNILPQ